MQNSSRITIHISRPWQAWLIVAVILAIQFSFFWTARYENLGRDSLFIAWLIFLIFDAICLYLVNLPIIRLTFDTLRRAVIVEKWRLYSGTNAIDFAGVDIANIDVAKLESTENTSYRLRLTMRGGAKHFATGDLGSSNKCETLAVNLRKLVADDSLTPR